MEKGISGRSVAGSIEWIQQQNDNINKLTEYYMENEKVSEQTARWKAIKALLDDAMH